VGRSSLQHKRLNSSSQRHSSTTVCPEQPDSVARTIQHEHQSAALLPQLCRRATSHTTLLSSAAPGHAPSCRNPQVGARFQRCLQSPSSKARSAVSAQHRGSTPAASSSLVTSSK
jgi:hypothetical protein